MRKSRVSQNTIELLITLFIAGTPARSSATLCGINLNTAVQWYHRLRTIIYTHVQKEHYVFDGAIEIDERYFGGRRKEKEEGEASGKTIVFGLYKRDGRVYTCCCRQVNGIGIEIFEPNETAFKNLQWNAIEKLGKNLIGIRAMMNHESIITFVCFGWGYDFDMEQSGDFVHSKVSMLNEFYFLNRIHIFKRDGDSNRNSFSPTSMFFREKEWTKDEMFEIMKEIAETSFRYYIH